MGNYIVKPDKDEDFYVVWSSNVDGPLYWGSKHILLLEMDVVDGPDPKRFDRADEYGSSSYPGFGRWGTDFVCYNPGVGYLKREDMKKFCLRIEGVSEEFAAELLEPFEDDE